MRQESEKIARAFAAHLPARAARTETDGTHVFLHNNMIAWWNPDGSLSLTMAGWGSATTRERLNAICEVLGYGRPFHQKDHVQYHGNREISTSNVVTYHPLKMADPVEWMKRNAA